MNDVFNAPTKKKDLVQDREPSQFKNQAYRQIKVLIKSREWINVSSDVHDEPCFQRTHKKRDLVQDREPMPLKKSV